MRIDEFSDFTLNVSTNYARPLEIGIDMDNKWAYLACQAVLTNVSRTADTANFVRKNLHPKFFSLRLKIFLIQPSKNNCFSMTGCKIDRVTCRDDKISYVDRSFCTVTWEVPKFSEKMTTQIFVFIPIRGWKIDKFYMTTIVDYYTTTITIN